MMMLTTNDDKQRSTQRVLGLDIGDVRVGIACVDLSHGIPQPIGTFLRANGQAEERILRIIEEQGIATIVAGLPLGEKGERSAQCESVERFCRRISRRKPHILFSYVDEYGSTLEAEERFRAARLGQSRRRSEQARKEGVIDALAAATILERFLTLQRMQES
jgi:putative transcription antitermination factor YqgF